MEHSTGYRYILQFITSYAIHYAYMYICTYLNSFISIQLFPISAKCIIAYGHGGSEIEIVKKCVNAALMELKKKDTN